MANIFENAYFGKAYKTRDGRKAIFLGFKNPYEVLVLYNVSMTNYPILDTRKVRVYDGKVYTALESGSDIVSEWQEPIDEEELDRLEEEVYPYEYTTSLNASEEADYINGLREAFKKGYRASLKQ